MLKPNIHSPSRRYLTEQKMSNSVRTGIFRYDLEMFEFFLDSSGLEKIRIGFYEYKYPHLSYVDIEHGNDLQKCILYEIPDDDETKEILTMLSLKHGSLEDAYRDFRDDLENLMATTTINK